MSRRGLLSLLGAGAALPLGGCGLFGGDSYRFRMTVEVETPRGLRRGSGILEVTASKNIKILPEEAAGSSGLRGQAVVIETDSAPIFVLLKLPDARGTLQGKVTATLLPEAKDSGIDAYVAAVRKLGGWSADYKGELPQEYWPMMVQFEDMRDPKSVQLIDPKAMGVKRILLETTEDDVSSGINARLPWLRDPGLTLDPEAGPTIHPTLAQTIRQRDFSTEIKR